jgi:alkaline phosphatase D
LDYGDLLRVHLLDTRQYRTDQRCGQAETKPCRTIDDKGPSEIIGSEQEAWLGQGMTRDFRWHLLGQQVMVMPFRYPESRADGVTNMDSWSGYPAARARLVKSIQDRRLTNVVVATGDVHKHHAGVIPSRDDDFLSKPVATEYVGTSIATGGDGSDIPAGWEKVLAENPHTTLLNDRRGYQVFTIGRKEWRTDVIAIDRISTRDGKRSTIGSFVTLPERPGAERA